MSRVLLVLIMLAVTATAVIAYRDPEQLARAADSLSDMLRNRTVSPAHAVHIPRRQGGEFALHAKINGVTAPMVIDTGYSVLNACQSCSRSQSSAKPSDVAPTM